MDLKTKKEIGILFKYLNLKTPLQKADVIFLAGGAVIEPVYKAAELYKKGYSKKIIILAKSGTFSNPQWVPIGEATVFKNKLIELGVKEEDIYAENLATNSYEEAVEFLPFANKHGMTPKKVIVVDRPIHQRREWATFAKQNPDLKFISCSADEELEYSQTTIDRLVAETERLVRYFENGSLIKQEFSKEVKKAWKNLKDKVDRVL